VDGELVEREHEVLRLRAGLERVLVRRAVPIVVSGPAGIGKTRLLGGVDALAEELGVRVGRAGGHELEESLAFGIARQLLEPFAVTDTQASETEDVLASVLDVALPGSGISGGDVLDAVVHRLYRLVARLSRQAPLVLVIDDVQWADRCSRRWLGYLCRRLEGLALGVALAAREPSELVAEGIEVDRESRAVHIPLAPLSLQAVRDVLARRAGCMPGPAFAARFCELTGGNAFLMCELAAEVVSPRTSLPG
jgi:hypothetical protein